MSPRALLLAAMLSSVTAAAAHAEAIAPPSRAELLERIIHRGNASPLGDRLDRALSPQHATSPLAVPQPGPTWSSEFAYPGLDGPPTSAIYFNGDLVVAGNFTAASGEVVNGIARWDGHAWSPMGAGFVMGARALTVWRGHLVAGGQSPLGSGAYGALAIWNGSSWDALGGMITGTVQTMATIDSSLVVGGLFQIGPSLTQFTVARWNGTAWADMGGGVNGYVFSVTPYADGLVVGGQFDHAGSVEAHSIAFWHNGNWSPMGSGLRALHYPSVAYSLETLGSDLLVAGQFDSAGTVATFCLAHWNGVDWSAVAGTPADMQAVTLGRDGERIAVSAYGMVRAGWYGALLGSWDGVSFALDSTHIDYTPLVLASDRSRLAMGGSFRSVDDRDIEFVAIRDQGTWQPAVNWRPALHGLGGNALSLAQYGSSLFASGDFNRAADDTGWVATPGVARWDNGHWRPAGNLGPSYQGALHVWGDSLYAAVGGVRRWNGTDWLEYGAPFDLQLDHLESFAGTLWAASSWCGGSCAGVGRFGLYRLVGGTWTPVTPPAQVDTNNCYVSAMKSEGARLWVAWGTNAASDGIRTLLCFYDGTSWSAPVGSFWGGRVDALASFRGQICVSGQFATVNELTIPYFAMLTSSGWNGFDAPPTFGGAMVATDSRLFVGSGRSLYAFDGAGWSTLANDMEGGVATLLLTDHSLWLGGGFRSAGGKLARGISRLDFESTPGAGYSRSLRVSPNPSHNAVTLQFTLPRAGRVRVTISDINGRRVATPVNSVLGAGTFSIAWSGRDDAGRSQPAGLYFARIEPDGWPAYTQRIVRVP